MVYANHFTPGARGVNVTSSAQSTRMSCLRMSPMGWLSAFSFSSVDSKSDEASWWDYTEKTSLLWKENITLIILPSKMAFWTVRNAARMLILGSADGMDSRGLWLPRLFANASIIDLSVGFSEMGTVLPTQKHTRQLYRDIIWNAQLDAVKKKR